MKNTENTNHYCNKTNFKFQGFDEPWTKLPNNILDNNKISLKAVGLYAKIVRFQNAKDHKIYISALNKKLKEGKDAIRRAMHELIEFGYITREPMREKNGQLVGYLYTVYATPIENTPLEPSSESTTLVDPTIAGTTYKKKIGLKENLLKENKDVVDDAPSKLEILRKLFMDYKIQTRLTPQMINLLKLYEDKLDLEVWEEIFVQASEDSVAKKYNYIKKLLEEFTAAKIKTMEDLESYNKNYKASKEPKKVEPKVATKKNRFDNFDSDRTKGYTLEQLEQAIKESQSTKFTEKPHTQVIDIDKALEQAIMSIGFWDSLTKEQQTDLSNYGKNTGRFLPRYMLLNIDN